MPESQMRLIVDTAREHLALRESLQDGSAYHRATEVMWEQRVLPISESEMRRLVDAALKVEGTKEQNAH
jgi:hypothetical protein